MTTRFVIASLAVIGLCFIGNPLLAHHGTGISYDLEHPPITLKGVVTEFRWANPHVQLYMDVKDEKGKVTSWAIEGNSIANWARLGYNRNTVKVGQEVTVIAYPSKVKNTPSGVIVHATTPDGKEVLRFWTTPAGPGGN